MLLIVYHTVVLLITILPWGSTKMTAMLSINTGLVSQLVILSDYQDSVTHCSKTISLIQIPQMIYNKTRRIDGNINITENHRITKVRKGLQDHLVLLSTHHQYFPTKLCPLVHHLNVLSSQNCDICKLFLQFVKGKKCWEKRYSDDSFCAKFYVS